MSNYLVLSFDYVGNSSVKLHCMTSYLNKAQTAYAMAQQNNPDVLVELIEVSEEFICEDGFNWFWPNGRTTNDVKVLHSNNRNQNTVIDKIFANL